MRFEERKDLSRRQLAFGLVVSSLLANIALAAEPEDPFYGVPTQDLSFPDEVDPYKLYGTRPPDEQQRTIGEAILRGAPTGPRPIDVARYFLSKKVDPHFIEQWPRSEAWNPVIVRFFDATNQRASNDMVAWCAAFVNWCLVRAGRTGSGSPSSQSFLDPARFEYTTTPRVGDLVVFTCYRETDDQPLGIGHVGFVGAQPASDFIKVLGGNQSKPGNSSIISESPFRFVNRPFYRCISGRPDGTCMERVLAVLKHPTFIRIV